LACPLLIGNPGTPIPQRGPGRRASKFRRWRGSRIRLRLFFAMRLAVSAKSNLLLFVQSPPHQGNQTDQQQQRSEGT